ncbi:mandelate racemase/muconate lactonizing enzyme family protein [Egibacter rhizosphaerae]|uniref:Mandelate racemase/muconate lactonizing enzyme family protein n=1 Tax=Egibacter rhizosphaerae TaxID=1670831 RepID=A0A411YB62_9ACTN|nr:mandelate racemase/muconate lactonizing enzyme family protein [Egibacter rhizosphaerae]QBI18425.1 mandelate racemase/muconate lactonizing enzyme family protein [Egibacter rhizosphaerae]
MSRRPQVVKIEPIPVAHQLPSGHRYGSARGQIPARAATLVRLETSEGVVGWGEGFGPPGPVVAGVAELRDEVVGQPVDRIVPLVRHILQTGYHRGLGGAHLAALSGVEIALWDAWGRTLGVPVTSLLGGRAREELVPYASTGYVLDHEDGEAAYAAQLETVASDGFPAAKVKLGLGAERDRRRAELAREKLGDDRVLMVDFNGNYTADLAIETLMAIRDLRIAWVEEPVPPEDLDGLARVRAAGVPIATGEALYTRYGFRPVIASQLADVVQPDVAKCGGIAEARVIIDLAHTWNLRVSPHVWGGAVAQAASLQLLAAVPATPHTAVAPQPLWLEFDRGANRLRDDLLVTPIRPVDGVVPVPDGPGLGVEIDEDAVTELRVRTS